MRDVSIETVDSVGGSWAEVANNRPILSVTAAEFGLAEEVISLMRFVNGTFEVGIGESLRPYQQLYTGPRKSHAEDIFWATVRRHASYQA